MMFSILQELIHGLEFAYAALRTLWQVSIFREINLYEVTELTVVYKLIVIFAAQRCLIFNSEVLLFFLVICQFDFIWHPSILYLELNMFTLTLNMALERKLLFLRKIYLFLEHLLSFSSVTLCCYRQWNKI